MKSTSATVFSLIISLSSIGIFASSAAAAPGVILVSGDTNITSGLMASQGNRTFFRNILQGGHTVKVLSNTFIPTYDTNIVDYYGTLSGVTATMVSGTVTPATLLGVNLFFSVQPDDAFSASEITALNAFATSGGAIFFLGDNFAPKNVAINSALAALGTSLSILTAEIDNGFHTATGSQIAVNAFTANVSSLLYASTSQVIGGTPLFFASQQQPFVAFQSVVPEPSGIVLLAVGLMSLLAFSSKQKHSEMPFGSKGTRNSEGNGA